MTDTDRLDLLADRAVRGAVSGALGRQIEHHALIASTQDRGRAFAEAGYVRAIVVADEQSAGRGRHGRSWLASRGSSLLASWVYRPLPSDPALFALLAGVAVARACEELGVRGARLKWPNDVQLEAPPGASTAKKIAGTLADAITDGSGGAVVLGIGVNVRQTAAELGELAGRATSCAAAGFSVDRLALLARITTQLDRLAGSVEERRGALAEWRERSSVLGHEVEVSGAAGSLRGLAREIADDGALVLETPSGDRRILAGEVTVI